jgi:hypothetical protein
MIPTSTFKKTLPLLLSLLVSGYAYAEEATTKLEGSLKCGAARWQATSTFLNLADAEWQPLHQEITVFPDAGSQGKSVRLDGRLVKKSFVKGQKVLDTSVTSWACIESTRGKKYVLLLYACSWGDERGGCAGAGKEWMRLFSTDGKSLTANYGRVDRRYTAFYKKLGLSKVMEGGQMQGIDEQAAPDKKAE